MGAQAILTIYLDSSIGHCHFVHTAILILATPIMTSKEAIMIADESGSDTPALAQARGGLQFLNYPVSLKYVFMASLCLLVFFGVSVTQKSHKGPTALSKAYFAPWPIVGLSNHEG